MAAQTKSMQELIQERLQIKLDYINKPDELVDRSNCKKIANALEQAIRTTLHNSKSHEVYFNFPFQKGCGQEVHDMLSSNQFEPFLLQNDSIHTVGNVFMSFHLQKKQAYFLFTK